MIGHAVVIVGGGPTGMMLGAELKLAGVDVAIIERRTSQDLEGSRARGLHARSIEVLDQRGIADRFLAEGTPMQTLGFATFHLDISHFPVRHNYGIALGQRHIERLLAGWVDELGVPVLRGRDVTGFAEDESGVVISLADGETLRASWLVGCDGGRSLVRKVAGIAFSGWDPTVSSLIAEVEMRDEPPLGIHRDTSGQHGIGRAETGRFGIVVTQPYAGQTGDPTLDDLSRAMITVWGTDFGVHSPAWISRFTDMSRQAETYRKGRVLLAGDAAHVHYPVGGQGLNLGLQDAVNLGWKLAQVVHGTSSDELLDTYHAERHPVAAGVLQITMAQTALLRAEPRVDAVREVLIDLLRADAARDRLAARMSGLGIHYDLGDGNPLLGRRVPDLDLTTGDGPRRVFSLLHDARPVLLDLGYAGDLDIAPWADRVRKVDASVDGAWELPALGAVTPPTAVLIRPDGYVAWVGEGSDAGLTEALTRWFGPGASDDGTGGRRARAREIGRGTPARDVERGPVERAMV